MTEFLASGDPRSVWETAGRTSARFPVLDGVQKLTLERRALNELSENLSGAYFTSAPQLGPRHRWRHIAALNNIANYLEALQFPRTATADLRELAVALSELDSGIVRHFLKPAKVGANMSPGDVWIARAFLCMAADFLIASGRSENSVFEWISNSFGYLQPALSRIPTGVFKRGTIRNWYLALRDPASVKTVKPTEGAISLFAKRWVQADEVLKQCPHRSPGERFGWLVAITFDEAIMLAARASSPEATEVFKKMAKPGQTQPLSSTCASPSDAYSSRFGYALT